jgi:hypothetical protein
MRTCPAETTLNALNASLPENEFAEVLVRRDQERTPRVRLLQDNLVWNARGQFRDVPDVVAIVPESLHHCSVNAFICQQVHAVRVPTG